MNKKLIAILMSATALTACSKLTKANYDELKMGMTQSEVESILGSADHCGKTLGATSCTWGDEEAKYVKIVFMGDKAATFSYDRLN